ncbi:MAG TPA: 2-amino-4-hydroxy-6-hydroxymethyldihydropteridine diphosphokinase [Bacteroidales bacterium]|nr:2-amino-4-hydroxy-6-hydroxymethyldihydropteridine diphosphokinase [Bacteroidales bacterium]
MVCFSLGSNMGERAENLRQALVLLDGSLGNPTAVSSVYETEPWGVEHHENYLNMAVSYETTWPPEKIFTLISSIEKKLGRIRSGKTIEPRTIDIDILFYDGLVIKTETLAIPHPRIRYRRFVLEPLAEIMENFHDPETGLTIKELLLQCPDTCTVLKTDIKLFSHDV